MPAAPNLGVGTSRADDRAVIVLATSPFPGTVADPNGASGGPGFLTPSAMTGSGGISGLQPASSTGARGSATMAPTGSNGQAARRSSSARGPTTPSPRSSRRSRATPSPTTPSMPRPRSVVLSMDRSDVLPPGQVYRGGRFDGGVRSAGVGPAPGQSG